MKIYNNAHVIIVYTTGRLLGNLYKVIYKRIFVNVFLRHPASSSPLGQSIIKLHLYWKPGDGKQVLFVTQWNASPMQESE